MRPKPSAQKLPGERVAHNFPGSSAKKFRAGVARDNHAALGPAPPVARIMAFACESRLAGGGGGKAFYKLAAAVAHGQAGAPSGNGYGNHNPLVKIIIYIQ
jgi:hypothetical protein